MGGAWRSTQILALGCLLGIAPTSEAYQVTSPRGVVNSGIQDEDAFRGPELDWGLPAAPGRPKSSSEVRQVGIEGNISVPGWPDDFDGAKDHLVVFQFGKVASTTLQTGLGSCMTPPHFLTSDDTGVPCPRGFKTHRYSVAQRAIAELEPGSRMWIVTVTRNRFSRDIASYFQSIEKRFTREQVLDMPMEELHEDFRSTYHYGSWVDNWYQEWFWNGTGVNMTQFSYPTFHPSRGWIRVGQDLPEGRRLEILLIRFEDIAKWRNLLWSAGIRNYHQEELHLNNGDRKWYATKYEQFVRTYKYSEHEMDAILNGDMMKFYSPEEIAAFMSKSPMEVGSRSYDLFRSTVTVGGKELLMHDLGEEGADGDLE